MKRSKQMTDQRTIETIEYAFLIKMAKAQLAAALRHGTPIVSFTDYERKLMRICLEQMREEIIVLLETATTTIPKDYFAGALRN
jgi:hypothetical protein